MSEAEARKLISGLSKAEKEKLRDALLAVIRDRKGVKSA